MSPRVEQGDIEQELRELFREKVGEAPVGLPDGAAAPQPVLRRGRRRQVGTVLGAGGLTLVLLVGSVAGLSRILAGGKDRDRSGNGGYEVFERTATIEAFTTTSPSDWFLVNEWPLSLQIAVEGSSGSGSKCIAVPGEDAVECQDMPGESSSRPLPVPHGLPALQLTNVDVGLDSNVCRDGLPETGAALYVALDAERAIDGIADPSIQPWPAELREPGAAGGTCGAGRYATFSVNGEPFFAWIGLGDEVSDADRAIVLSAFESMTVDDSWQPDPPDQATPAYVIAGGALREGGTWRLDLRPGEHSPELSLEGVEPTRSLEIADPAVPIAFCCPTTDGLSDATMLDVTFGFVDRDATGVELRVTEGDALTGDVIDGTLVPIPPSLDALDFDLFFIDGTAGLSGEVVPLGLDTEETVSPAPAGSRAQTVELSGTFEGHDWAASFRGSFVDRTACIYVDMDAERQAPLCPGEVGDSLASGLPSLHGWLTSFHLLAGSVPPEVEEIRFVGDDDAVVPQSFHCETGPLGWTDPDVSVCALALPANGSGTLEYLDAGGSVVHDEGIAWGVSEPEVPTPVEPVHGGAYWAVYPWLGAAGTREANDVVADLFERFGIQAYQGDLNCDQGAREALGTDAAWRVAVYFETEQEANQFASQAGLLGHEADPVIARVTTYCLD
jgi:hypothetical protein